VGVAKGPAFAHEADDELRSVDFDDPSAVERTVDVTVRIEDLFGPNGRCDPPESGEVTFRWGGLGRLDGPARTAYMEAMAGMGRVVAFLKTRSDRDGEVYIPVLRGALLGQVDDLGEISFPGLGEDERSFIGSIQTLDVLRRIAAEPRRSTVWEGPLIN
jgi:hypothetical protein